MSGPPNPHQQQLLALAKDEANSASDQNQGPPPAYSPPVVQTLLRARLAAIIQRRAELSVAEHTGPRAPGTSMFDGLGLGADNGEAMDYDDEDNDDGAEDGECDDLRSPITIRVSSAVRVSSDNNYVCLSEDPAAVATRVAGALMDGLRAASERQGGVPMVDEDGHPRPIRIEVDCGMDVNGSGNVVGSEAVFQEMLRLRNAMRPREQSHQQNHQQQQQDEARLAGGGASSITPDPGSPSPNVAPAPPHAVADLGNNVAIAGAADDGPALKRRRSF